MTTEIFKKRRLGIKTAIVVSMLWGVCGVCSSSCGAAILTDDFNDNLTGVLWSIGSYTENCTESAFGLYEAYQRLEYRATLTSSESYAEEFYYSRQWWLDVNQDFAFKINYHTTLLPWQCVMMWIGMTPSTQIVVDTDQSYLIAAGCCEGVNYYAWSGVGDQGDFKFRSANDGTLYVSYAAAADKLYLSYTGYGPTNAWQTLSGVLKGQWGGVPIHVVLGGTAMGAGTVSTGQFYLDNFILDSGVVSNVIVPDVVGLPQAEAKSEISSAGLTVGSVTFVIDTSIPAGHVVSQWPAPESVVIVGSAVNLVVSVGSSIAVPDVTGMSLADARSAITSAGLTVGTIAASYHPSVPNGLIISQSPPAGQSASIGTPVNIVQSNGRHYAGGSGAAEDPFMISIPQDLIELAATSTDWGKCFILTADIDMSAYTGMQYRVIGNSVTNFRGSFDGNGHIIRNLTYSTNYSHSYIGLFGYVNNAIIKNIGLENVNISSNGDFLGGIIGCMKSGSIDNCYSTGSVKGRFRVGGLVGVMSNSTITNCYSASNVSGLSDVGGLMGLCSDSYSLILNWCSLGDVMGTSTSVGGLVGNNGASVANCCSMSNVTGRVDGRILGGLVGYNSGSICNSSCTGNVVGDDYVGGLVGSQHRGSIINCYSSGNVTGDSYIGGLVGYQYNYSDSKIEKCYSAGKVTGNTGEGGLLGYKSGSSSIVAACFWNIETSGMTDGVGNMNPAPGDVEGKTTAEMQMLSTFMDAGWDFTDTDADAAEWWMPNSNYPRLFWGRYGGGFGTIFIPYQIWTAEQMNAIGATPDDWDKHFKLMADMDMSAYTGTQYHVIGNSTMKFTGSFDGNGYKISNLTYSTSKAEECLGLFGRVENAVIKNLALNDVSLASGSGNVGGLVGWNDSGALSVCSATGSIRGTGHLGGLVGRNDAGSMTACYANCSINGTSIIGGLVGGNYAGSIQDCYTIGSVAGTGNFIGGLTGYNNKGKLATCYAADSVGETGNRVGGLVGWNSTDSEVIACFWDTQASGKSAGVGGGSSSGMMGKTTAEMKMSMTFIDAEWKFTNTEIGWLMLRPNEDYPRLSWQEIYAGDIVGMYGVDLADYEVLARYWMHTDCPATSRCENADIDGNGAVDLIDFSILVENWMRQ